MEIKDKMINLEDLKTYYDNASNKYYYWEDITDTLTWTTATKYPKTDCFLTPNSNNLNILNAKITNPARGSIYRATGWCLDYGDLHTIRYTNNAVINTCPFVFTENYDDSDDVFICYPTSTFDYRSTSMNQYSFWIKKMCDCVIVGQNYIDKDLYIYDYSGLRSGGSSGDIKIEKLSRLPFEFPISTQ